MTDILRTLFGIESASTQAERFEALFWYITLMTGSVGLLIYLCLLYFCVVYRRGKSNTATPRILGSHSLELAWTITPLVIFLTFFAWGAVIYNDAAQPPEDAMQIDVIGKQWMWKAQYHPKGQRVILGLNNEVGPQRATEAKEGGELWLPVNRSVRLKLISEDVIHDFGVPAFRTKVDVLPGRYSFCWYHPTKVGLYDVFCDQYCGTNHSRMIGKIRVVTQEEFDAWLAGLTPAVPASTDPAQASRGPLDGTPAWEGQQLFRVKGCIDCHTPSAGSGTRNHPVAPNLEGLWGATVPLESGGTVVVDDRYVRSSILYPRDEVVEGWKPIMPSYHGTISADEMNQLIAYIRWLKNGRIIPSTEKSPRPVGAPTRPPEPAKPPSAVTPPSGTTTGTQPGGSE